MAEIGSLDVNSPTGGSGGPPPMLLIGGAVVLIGAAVLLSRRSGAAAPSQIAPGSSANIAFSSLENSLLNFQGLYTANTAAFNQQQQQIMSGIAGIAGTQQNIYQQELPALQGITQIQQQLASAFGQIIPGISIIQQQTGNDPNMGNWLLQLLGANRIQPIGYGPDPATVHQPLTSSPPNPTPTGHINIDSYLPDWLKAA